MASNEEIREFLKKAKRLISRGEKDFVKRTYDHPSGQKVKWKEALMDVGFTEPSQVWKEILHLTPNHWEDGPVVDVDRPSEGKVIWVFKKEVGGVLTYIKLKIDHRGCKCLSFHKDW